MKKLFRQRDYNSRIQVPPGMWLKSDPLAPASIIRVENGKPVDSWNVYAGLTVKLSDGTTAYYQQYGVANVARYANLDMLTNGITVGDLGGKYALTMSQGIGLIKVPLYNGSTLIDNLLVPYDVSKNLTGGTIQSIVLFMTFSWLFNPPCYAFLDLNGKLGWPLDAGAFAIAVPQPDGNNNCQYTPEYYEFYLTGMDVATGAAQSIDFVNSSNFPFVQQAELYAIDENSEVPELVQAINIPIPTLTPYKPTYTILFAQIITGPAGSNSFLNVQVVSGQAFHTQPNIAPTARQLLLRFKPSNVPSTIAGNFPFMIQPVTPPPMPPLNLKCAIQPVGGIWFFSPMPVGRPIVVARAQTTSDKMNLAVSYCPYPDSTGLTEMQELYTFTQNLQGPSPELSVSLQSDGNNYTLLIYQGGANIGSILIYDVLRVATGKGFLKIAYRSITSSTVGCPGLGAVFDQPPTLPPFSPTPGPSPSGGGDDIYLAVAGVGLVAGLVFLAGRI